MNKFVLTLAVLAAATFGSGAFAQSAPVRGVGLLALNASDAGGGSGNAGVHTALIEIPDGGGGGHVGVRATRGSGDTGDAARNDDDDSATSDTVPAKTVIAPGDPTAPPAMAAKRTNYRWQALVPGALK